MTSGSIGSAQAPTYRLLIKMCSYEFRLGCRSAAWRLITALCFVYGCSIGHVDGRGAGAVAYAAGEAGQQILSLVAICWMSMLGIREMTLRTRTIVFVKPQPCEQIVVVRFVGGLLQALSFLVALFLGSVLMRLIGGSSISMLAVFPLQLFRAGAVLFFASAASFTLAILSESVIAGMLIGLYIVLTVAGKSWLAKFYDPSPIQNVGTYCAFGVALLCLTLRLFARKRRGSAKPSPWIATVGLAALLTTGFQLFYMIRDGHDPHTHSNPALDLMASQDTNMGGTAAGFLLPDQNGNPIGVTRFAGKVQIYALWAPGDPDSGLLLAHLKSIQSKYGDRGVQVVAICLSADNSTARTYALGEDLNYPVVTDWGTIDVPEKLAASPMASAYRTTNLPFVAVTDRRRRVVDLERGSTCYDGPALDRAVETQLQREPR